MAKAGHANIAITACFAGPLFNMLLSLALGFSSYLRKLGQPSAPVVLTPELGLGCFFLIGYNIVLLSVGHLNQGRLPPWFALFARGWYAAYFVLAVLSGVVKGE
jgi:sodium/potassium/calcium exchanger 6